jgi:probable phosphoglycerate mutase
MHLGEWDGRFIREIQESFPEEYERRGRDILRYKRGTEAENHYDLQYRVMKALRRILESERKREAQDIVIVAHAGVIRVIIANLRGIPLEEAIKTDIPRGSIHVLHLGTARDRQYP